MSEVQLEECILCGDETTYEVTAHIDTRHDYIEGMGQLCRECGKEHL
jgi:hypothetical protein